MSALSQLKTLVGDLFGEQEDIEADDIYSNEDGDYEEDIIPVKEKKSKISVVPHINSRGYEVMVVSPKSFDESLEVSKNLIERKTIVLNLELLDREQSQRIVDFLAGATFALNGHQQKIGEGVFIFTPNNVNISAEQEKKMTSSIADAFWNQVK